LHGTINFIFAAVPTGGSSNSDESLWVSDGTVTGTIRLNDPVDYERPKHFTVFNGALYFVAYSNSSYGNKLYKTDGTELGTSYVALSNNTSSVSTYSIATDGNYLYLAADNITYGAELFRYDGTSSQCDVSDGVSGSGSSNPTELYVNGSDLYFVANLTATSAELYTTLFTSIPTATKGSATNLFTLYPNPTTNQVSVKSSEQIVSLSLINQLGTVLFETSDSSIFLESYSEGVYFVKVQLQNGQSSFEKIILVK